MISQMDTIWGLPAHPLFVHAPIMLIPLAAAGAAVVAVSRRLRDRFGVLVGLGGVGALIGAFLANGSGEEFAERLGVEVAVEKHQNLAETTLVLTAAFAVLALVNLATDRIHALQDSTVTASVLPVVTACLGVLATIWMIRTGHEGARLVWENVVD